MSHSVVRHVLYIYICRRKYAHNYAFRACTRIFSVQPRGNGKFDLSRQVHYPFADSERAKSFIGLGARAGVPSTVLHGPHVLLVQLKLSMERNGEESCHCFFGSFAGLLCSIFCYQGLTFKRAYALHRPVCRCRSKDGDHLNLPS